MVFVTASNAPEGYESVRGVIISTHTDGSDWASPQLPTTMRDIAGLGADWVSTHPYGWIRNDGSIRFHPFDPDSPPDPIAKPIRDAHEAGLKILIKPHLGYWGSKFSWRGDIKFESEEEWTRFFADYEAWIVHLARSCRDADAFVVGTELDSTLHREADWRRVIASVREQTDIPLTYAANWTCYQRVGFWDELDVIGVQAYFPLAEEAPFSPELLTTAWDGHMRDIREFAGVHNRPVVFTELGYNRSFQAPIEPWAYATDGKDAEPIQALCMRVALRAVEDEPTVLGAFLWKWFPDPHPVGRNFQLATPVMRETISDIWSD